MTRETAIRKIRKLLGYKGVWQVGQAVTSPERREAATMAREEAVRVRDTLRAEQAAVVAAAIEAWGKSEALAVSKELVRRAFAESTDYRFRIGHTTLGGVAWEVLGEGDTWEEAFAAMAKKQAGTEDGNQ